MHRQLRHPTLLALLALLLSTPGLTLAHGEGPQQTVDGYTVTVALPEKGFYTGRNPVAVSLWDWQGYTPDATVTVGLLAFTPLGDGHGDSHGEAVPADGHAAEETDGHAAADSHDAASTGDHEAMVDDHAANSHDAATTDGQAHDAANAIEGQGLALAPVALAVSEELGEYRGELTFDEVGAYTVSVVFTIDGEEHGAIFDVAVAQSRPRGLVLGGFALVNALAIGAASVLKWRKPAKPATKPARPAAATTTTAEE
jgi:hypothetical protein